MDTLLSVRILSLVNHLDGPNLGKEAIMADSVYKIIDLVGSSPTSWEEAAKNAVETAGRSLRDLRVAEIIKLDMKVENGKVTAYRARVKLSFKYGGE
jgi:flavin-binding protein dodecin